MMTRRSVLWAVAALLGIAVTAALTWSVSRLAALRIGLASQPPSVIQGLAPPSRAAHRSGAAAAGDGHRPTPGRPAPGSGTTAPPEAVTVTTSAAASSAPAALSSAAAPAAPGPARRGAASPEPRGSPGGDGLDASGGSASRRAGPAGGSASRRDD